MTMEIYTHISQLTISDFSRESMFHDLSVSMEAEKHLLPQNTNVLLEQFTNGLSMIIVDDNKIVGHATLWDLKVNRFYEFGTVWVCTSMRGKGVGTKLYRNLLCRHTQKNILETTTNPIAISAGQQAGLVAVNRKDIYDKVWKMSCCCSAEKMCTINSKNCLLAWNESQCDSGDSDNVCVFRVSLDTSRRLRLSPIPLPE